MSPQTERARPAAIRPATTRKGVGFIGLGVMGERMCRNLARRSGRTVVGFDLQSAPLERLRADGVKPADGLAPLIRDVDTVFLALPSGREVESVCRAPEGLVALSRPGDVVIDLGTSPVDLTRALAGAFAERGVQYADAPIARTRQAAEDGTLSIMVGADAATFAAIRPLLACLGSDITHCGNVGCGQIVKILNNMVLIETVVALAEALAVARRAGLDGTLLFATLAMGSADSFALRNHGMKAMLPEVFPEGAFSTEYARKDLSYALALAAELGLAVRGAELARKLLDSAAESGRGKLYWPVISQIIGEPEPARREPAAR
jgi:3-hydroxyisobutyrate dehydrogenase-like beta-hydroxyacid dehydrogenase